MNRQPDLKSILKFTDDSKDEEYRAEIASQVILKYFPDRKCNILDVGCGRGNFLMKLEEKGYSNLFGVDRNPKTIRQIQERTKNITLHQLEFQNTVLPFEDGFADIVTCMEVFGHLYDPLALLNEISRVTSPYGKALFTFPNEYYIWKRILFLRGIAIVHPLKRGAHIKFFNRYTSIEFVNTCFEIVQFSGFNSRDRLSIGQHFPALFAKWFMILARKRVSDCE